MFRHCALLVSIWCGFSGVCWGCSCRGWNRPCETLHADAVFVGRVLETVPDKGQSEKNSWITGYTMRFAVDEWLRGGSGTEVLVTTGSGGGDCGTPLSPGERFLIFAHRASDGLLGTGLCSGNRHLANNVGGEEIVEPYRVLANKTTASIFGRVSYVQPVWEEDDIREGSPPKPTQGVMMYATSEGFTAAAKTGKDGSYEFHDLPNGKYTVLPETTTGWDFDHEYFEDRYQADISNGQCKDISFTLQPSTRIKGHVILPSGLEVKTVEVVAIPTSLKKMNQFSGKSDFTDENGSFDLWPLPPGDYYVGVNINSSPKPDSPFSPTYYPGVTNISAANVVNLKVGEVKEIELPLLETAQSRVVHFVAVGPDGKPIGKIYIQREDLRHPGDASSYENVELDSQGRGIINVYSGYSYHLHGQYGDWCSNTVSIPAGSNPVEVRFVMNFKGYCDIYEIDGLKR